MGTTSTVRRSRRRGRRQTQMVKRMRLRGGTLCIPCIAPSVTSAIPVFAAGALGIMGNETSRSQTMRVKENGDRVYTYQAENIKKDSSLSQTSNKKQTKKKQTKKKSKPTKIEKLCLTMTGSPNKGWTLTKKTNRRQTTIRFKKGTSIKDAKSRFRKYICSCEKRGYKQC